MKPANYAPVYAAMYPKLAEIARSHGYALAIHGTLGRDMDLIAVPWVDEPSEPMALLEEMRSAMLMALRSETPVAKPHGRLAWTIGYGNCLIDLSFMPRAALPEVTP